MEGELTTTHEHGLVGGRLYRAVVDTVTPGAGPTEAVADIVEVDAWFDSLADAGAWVDEHAANAFDGRVEEHVWQESVSLDRESDRAVFGAALHPTGRFVDRVQYQGRDDDVPHAVWSFSEAVDAARFDPDVWAGDDTFWEHEPGTRKGFGAGPSRVELAEVHRDLVEAVRAAWRLCERLRDPYLPVPVGLNVPELVRGALEVVAAEVGGVEELVAHRPGSWEADHVRSLAALVPTGP